MLCFFYVSLHFWTIICLQSLFVRLSLSSSVHLSVCRVRDLNSKTTKHNKADIGIVYTFSEQNLQFAINFLV